MKIKESPSIILAFHGMLGRKKQTSLLLLLLTLVFSFLTAAVIYSVSSAQVLQDTRCELYGEWQYLRLSDTAADAAQVQGALPASAQVSTVIQNGIVLGADDGVAGGIGTADDTFAQLGRIVPISGDFPTQSDEIAMTTTLLDALGCSYDVGQTVTLKVAANDYDPLAGSGAVMEKAYTLCGVLPAVLVRPQITKPKEKPAKKFHLAQLPLAPQIGVGCAVLLIAVSCLYVGWRVMLPYNLDAPYACLSIKMNGTSGMPFSLKEDLAALPGVEEVSAAIDLTDTYTVTSDKIQSSQMLADIWVKDNGFYTDIPSLLRNAEKGTLNTTVCALPEDELRRIAADAGVSDEEIETLLAGDSVLTLWGDCYYDPAADAYYQKNTQTEGSIPVEPVFAAGDKLSIQYRRYTGQDEAGNEVYRTYTAQLPIVGVVKSANSYTLLTTDRLISSGTIFVSTALYHKMFESAGSYFMEKEGYSSLNVKLSAGSNFSLRRSISSIATRRNGILRADNYDLISQSYTEGTQSAFLVGILAVFGVLLGCALLVVLNLSAYEVQQQRLSLLLTLGVSPKKLVLSYAKLLLPVIVGTTLLVNIVVYAAVSCIVPIQSILDLIRIHTNGRVYAFHKPVGSQIMVSILLMVFWLSAALLPIFSFIRKKASKGDIL